MAKQDLNGWVTAWVEMSLRNMSKTCSFASNCLGGTSMLDKSKVDM